MPNRPSLLPREHGAYAELAFPLVSGLFLSGPSLAAVALAGAAVCFFLAHEPVAILMGVRGQRLKTSLEGRARGRAIGLLGSGALLGCLGWLGVLPSIRPFLLIPLAAGALLVPTVLAGKQKTVPGELLVVTAFVSLILPLGAASGARLQNVYGVALVWWGSFALGTLEVHAIKARHKTTHRNRWTFWASPVASGTVVAAVLWMFQRKGWSMASAILPPALSVFVLSILRVHPRHLKRVGWTLVGANVLTLILLLGPLKGV